MDVKKTRVLAMDYGDVRIGIAVSDADKRICGEAFTIVERDPERAAERILSEVRKREADTIVIGLPRNMDGSEGPRAELTRDFAHRLEGEENLTIRFWDERRSSVEAHAILRANGKKTKKHKKNVDAVAASLLLESYLDSLYL